MGGHPLIPRSEGFVTVADGERIWYETAGTGPDLILSHGLGGNAAVWYQQVPYFAEHSRVISWDQRGFGRSSNAAGKHGPHSAAGDLLAIMDHLGSDQADVVGQSMGGWAALGLALTAPDRVRSLVLSCTTGGIPVLTGPREAPTGASTAGALQLGQHPALGPRLPSVDIARAYLYQALGTFGSRPPDSEFFRILESTTFDDVALKNLNVPVLLITGEFDALMTPDLVRNAAAHLGQATVVEVPGRGHSIYFEDPDRWNEIVARFLEQTRSRPENSTASRQALL